MSEVAVAANPQVEADAREFGLHVRQGGWRLGMLVARNVERSKPGSRQDQSDRTDLGKVSVTRFAADAHVGKERVLRYLDAWERAADEGVVPHAADLEPGRELDLDADKLPDWSSYYTTQRAGVVSGEPERTPLTNLHEQESIVQQALLEIEYLAGNYRNELADDLLVTGESLNRWVAATLERIGYVHA